MVCCWFLLGATPLYFDARTEDGVEPTCVCLPPEYPGQAGGQCGLFPKHMYGMRAAADGIELVLWVCVHKGWGRGMLAVCVGGGASPGSGTGITPTMQLTTLALRAWQLCRPAAPALESERGGAIAPHTW